MYSQAPRPNVLLLRVVTMRQTTGFASTQAMTDANEGLDVRISGKCSDC